MPGGAGARSGGSRQMRPPKPPRMDQAALYMVRIAAAGWSCMLIVITAHSRASSRAAAASAVHAVVAEWLQLEG
jgi:hypothetical protein